MDAPNSSLASLAQPITKLVEVVAQGIGGLYSPLGTVLQAKADAKAQVILTEADIEQRELLARASIRIRHIEADRQKTIEAVVEEAKEYLPPTVSSAPVEKEWISQFFTCVQDVSSDELKKTWARILAGEVASPGRFSRRTLELLRTIDRQEAELFSTFVSFCFGDANGTLYFVEEAEHTESFRSKVGNIALKKHFNTIGLLSDQSVYTLQTLNDMEFFYGGRKHLFRVSQKSLSRTLKFWIEIRQLSVSGQQLATIVPPVTQGTLIGELSKRLFDRHEITIDECDTPSVGGSP